MLEISKSLTGARAIEDILPKLLDTLLTDVFPFAAERSGLTCDAKQLVGERLELPDGYRRARLRRGSVVDTAQIKAVLREHREQLIRDPAAEIARALVDVGEHVADEHAVLVLDHRRAGDE